MFRRYLFDNQYINSENSWFLNLLFDFCIVF